MLSLSVSLSFTRACARALSICLLKPKTKPQSIQPKRGPGVDVLSLHMYIYKYIS